MFISVSAESYYTNYSVWSDWSTKEITGNDLINVEKVKRYKYYHELVDSDYFIEGTNPDDYIINKKKSKKTTKTEWSVIKPDDVLNRVVTTKTEKEEICPSKVRYIFLLNNYYDQLNVSELQIESDNIVIRYDYECSKCSDSINKIDNNKLKERDSYIYGYNYLVIDLKDEYDIDSLQIKYFFTEYGEKYFKLLLSNEKDINKAYYEKNDFIKTNFIFDSSKYYKAKDIIGDDKLECKEKENTYYSYYDIMYEYNKTTREYSDYMEKPTTYYKKLDDTKYIEYYRYQTRKLIEKENKIDSNDEKSEEDIKETSKDQEEKTQGVNNNITKDELLDVIKKEESVVKKIEQLENSINNKEEVEKYNKIIEDINESKIQNNKLNIKNNENEIKVEKEKEERNRIEKEKENKAFNSRLITEDKKEEISTVADVPILQVKNTNYLFIIPLVIGVVVFGYLYYKYKKKN